MADDGWNGGICFAEPGLPKLLILSLERIGVVDPPEFLYREYDSNGTLRCDLMIFIAKSTRYPDVDPWFISTTGFRFPDTYRKAARKALRRLRVIYRHHLQRTPMGFFPPTEGRGRTWIARMRGLGREEEDLEDTVSHLSIYITGLDELYREQAAQLKQQVHRAEKATQEMEEQRSRTFHAEYSLAALQVQMDEKEEELEEQRARAARAEDSLAALQARMRRYEARWGIGGWIEEDAEEEPEEEEPMETHWDVGTQTEEEEPEETHWDKGTQTEDNLMDQYLPLKKRSLRIEEGSP